MSDIIHRLLEGILSEGVGADQSDPPFQKGEKVVCNYESSKGGITVGETYTIRDIGFVEEKGEWYVLLKEIPIPIPYKAKYFDKVGEEVAGGPAGEKTPLRPYKPEATPVMEVGDRVLCVRSKGLEKIGRPLTQGKAYIVSDIHAEPTGEQYISVAETGDRYYTIDRFKLLKKATGKCKVCGQPVYHGWPLCQACRMKGESRKKGATRE